MKPRLIDNVLLPPKSYKIINKSKVPQSILQFAASLDQPLEDKDIFRKTGITAYNKHAVQNQGENKARFFQFGSPGSII